ncbi:MAG: Hpt domain-containing protein [Lachnospiraceae bacterium]|nr:Hpt domain-containing protein [Lachnospiraceae bacterium]
MITVEKLKELGCNTDEGLQRCLGDAGLYLEFIPDALKKERYTELEKLIRDRNLDEAFKAAHALKGILANLSLDPLLEPVMKMTELLRSRTDTDYSELLSEMWERFLLFEKEL